MEFKIDYFYDYNINSQIDNFDMADKYIVFEENLLNNDLCNLTINNNIIKLHNIYTRSYYVTLIDNIYLPFIKFIIDNYGNIIISIRFTKFDINHNTYDIILQDSIYYNLYLINNYNEIDKKYIDFYKKYFYASFINKNFYGQKLLYPDNHSVYYTHLLKYDYYNKKIILSQINYYIMNIKDCINNITQKILFQNIKFLIVKYQEFLSFINDIKYICKH